jgi:ankyrin repeat protein
MNTKAIFGNDLLDATSNGNLVEVTRLIEHGADINFRDILNGGTCLHIAAGAGNLELVSLMLKSGANPNIYTQNTFTSPLGVAALKGNVDLVTLLLEYQARLSDQELITELLNDCREVGYEQIADLIEKYNTT